MKEKIINKKDCGFTLIELLIVIAILAILAGFVMVALDPMARFQDSRNTRRWSDVNNILAAIKLDQVDNGGAYHDNIADMADNTYYQIGEATTGCNTTCSTPLVSLQIACVNLLDLIDQGYMADIPIDPNATGVSSDMTGYYLYKYDSGQIVVGSCHEELGSDSTISTIEALR